MKEVRYNLRDDRTVEFRNNVDFCVGTGRMDLALQKEYFEQLKLVQKEIGFSHIRGHGLFCDQMAIYHEYQTEDGETKAEYNFTYLDLVMDNYRSVGLKPFLELGFMPYKLASGDQTIFYWRGNTTPPKSYEGWKGLVVATLSHLMDRYGADEAVTYPIEVWNEPNLPGFWKDADMQEYFRLFKETFWAIKELDSRFKVGGPAVCGGSDELWIGEFMHFCEREKIPLDFVTRHHYTTELPERSGHYGYAVLSLPDPGFDNLKTTRDIIDSYPQYYGLPIHITEFNTSYIPNCPIHDTNRNAAYLAYQLSRLGEVNESYSYWTFGDIFEEQGIPYAPFHGGFGLVANGCIPKPTFWTFKFFKLLKEGVCLLKTKECVVVKMGDGSYRGVLFNLDMENPEEELSIELSFFPENAGEEYSLITELVDADTCNPQKVWYDLGMPQSLSPAQKTLLQNAARPFISSDLVKSSGGEVLLSGILEKDAVLYFELAPRVDTGDRGFDYERTMKMY